MNLLREVNRGPALRGDATKPLFSMATVEAREEIITLSFFMNHRTRVRSKKMIPLVMSSHCP